jgi:hypothetical protein
MVAALPVLAMNPRTQWARVDGSAAARSEAAVGREFFDLNGGRSFTMLAIARCACIPVSILGAWIAWTWAKDLYGQSAALASLVMWTVHPMVLGHAALISTDLGAASLGLAASYVFWRWLNHPNWSRSLLGGFVLGLALLTKITMVALLVVWPSLWGLHRLFRRPARRAGPPGLAGLLFLLAVAIFTLNGGYGFSKVMSSCRHIRVLWAQVQSNGRSMPVPAAATRVQALFERIPVPLPVDYLVGAFQQMKSMEHPRPAYIRGQWREGVWWFYVYGMAVKTPVGLLVVLGLSAAMTLIRRTATPGWMDELVLLAPSLAVFALVSWQSNLNDHLRYALPAFPQLIVFAAKGVSGTGNRYRIGGGWLAVVAAVASSLSIYPYSLSYFNELCGGPAGGFAHLGGSALDWGQDVFLLRRWMRENAAGVRVHAYCQSSINLSAADLYVADGPRDVWALFPRNDSSTKGRTGQSALVAASVLTLLHEGWTVPGRIESKAPFRPPPWTGRPECTPVGQAGYTIFIFSIP